MSFNPVDLLEVAKELSKGNTEAHYRSAISRAYYSCFGYITQKISFDCRDQSVHRKLIQFLQNSPNPNDVKVGKRLELLFKIRKQADYVLNVEIKLNSCLFAINQANEIVKLFTKFI